MIKSNKSVPHNEVTVWVQNTDVAMWVPHVRPCGCGGPNMLIWKKTEPSGAPPAEVANHIAMWVPHADVDIWSLVVGPTC